MSTNLVPPPPEWFLRRDYGYTSGLDAEGWLIALLDRLKFDPIPWDGELYVSGDDDPFAAHRRSYPSNGALFDAYLEATDGPPGRFIRIPNAKAIRECLREEDAENALRSPAAAVLALELDATDDTLTREFAEWLRERRKAGSVNTATIRKLKSTTLRSWSDQRILQLLDLLFWRKVCVPPTRVVSDTVIGGWLYYRDLRESSDPLDKYKYSFKKLREASESIGALRYEQYESGKK